MTIKKIRVLHHATRGLENDAHVIQSVCASTCVSYPESHIRTPPSAPPLTDVDIHIFLEHIRPDYIPFAKHTFFVPNIEWCNTHDITMLYTHEHIRIIAKTAHAEKVLRRRFGDRVTYVPWHSKDMRIPSVVKCPEWLHVKGVSRFKNTQLVLSVWLKHPEWPTLHIIANGDVSKNGFVEVPVPMRVTHNITLYQYTLSDESLKHLMNSCAYHVCPSFVEGFGHYIHEGLSTGATVVTTHGRPMNELVTNPALLIRSDRQPVSMNLGEGYVLTEHDIESCIMEVIHHQITDDTSRRTFEVRGEAFKIHLNDTLVMRSCA